MDLLKLNNLSLDDLKVEKFKNFNEKEFEEVKKIFSNPLENVPNLSLALKISKIFQIPIHPKYIFFWNELNSRKFLKLLNYLKFCYIRGNIGDFSLSFEYNKNLKRYLELIGVEHYIFEEEDFLEPQIILEKKSAEIFLLNFNIIIDTNFNSLTDLTSKFVQNLKNLEELTQQNLDLRVNEILSKFCDFEIRDKGGTYVGARMGRPEKAKMRRIDGSPTGLFPIGKNGRFVNNLFEIYKNKDNSIINSQMRVFYCNSCKKEGIFRICEFCGARTEEMNFEKFDRVYDYKNYDLNLKNYIDNILKKFNWNFEDLPENVKGVDSLISKSKFVEHLGKGFLRAKNGVYVNKDATIRYDITQAGITHFKPIEIGTSVKKLKELGYKKDYLGNNLTNKEQIVEIFPQDVILPDCDESGDEIASDFIIQVGNFVDDLLEKFYGMQRFYNFEKKDDTVGHLIIGLAPHTSAGTIGRIIGYSRTSCCFSHPLWHAAQRRNLDGDETSIILLLDGFINFSKEFLPDRRGARTMDAPLVLTSKISIDQVDDEVWGMDITNFYPLDFYKSAKNLDTILDLKLKNIKIEQIVDRINKKGDEQFFNMKFTHSVENFNESILFSSYKHIPSMQEKVNSQMDIAKKIRAVDEDKTAQILIEKYFLKDINSNLDKFFVQDFKCSNCSEKFRRPLLNGKCDKCGNSKINFTINKGSILKYLEPSFNLVNNYNVSQITIEKLKLVNKQIKDVFGED